ncbi:hypothetical protein D9756_001784 [Leucocoprinus leucothites]|uniref:Chromatin modification-related protein n=1 Tax=Leucocoprinus leucothites TaxID=201217 RepID=A0A8H5LHP2_9AGAR|nr:hypothetical protein D9756_001784 [Leucoagaricus leucothites]
MSARTRSSTRKQTLQEPEESDKSRGADSEAEQSFNLEEKEQEIWDEVRDEHYDIIEQLPLTIHRQLTLLHQLDYQSRDYADNLLPTIKNYIQLRHQIARNEGQPAPSAVTDPSYSLQLVASPGGESTSTRNATPTSRRIGSSPAATYARSSSVLSPVPGQPKLRPSPTSTRELLSHIGWLNEEYLRTSREKVNIAQTAQDSVHNFCPLLLAHINFQQVDRHIRLLDQFIKEQEASLGPEPNAPVMLSMSELAVPKWSRPTRVSMSPVPEELERPAPPPPVQPGATVLQDRPGKRRPQKNRKNKEKEKEKEEQNVPFPLRITLPIFIDPNEPTWCYCNRISFGEMIGCDDPECKYEWFHLECVGLKEVPEDDEWYCQDCTQRREAKSRRR